MTAIEQQARSLFLVVVERAPDQWPAFLDEACAGNPVVRERVEELLRAHQAMGSIHAKRAGESTAPHPPDDYVGSVISHYKLLERIGEGGFGFVYMAEQTEPIRRKVALKILKPGMDTRQVVARFEAERQALALMDHPHIAKVLDAGTTDAGLPYFVMELVRGVPITVFCDEKRLPPRERLGLFVSVCQAVQHAHQKGVIHRDIKPSNVLVTLHDGTPVVKVIDFGIAKALGQPLTDKTLFTGYAQMIGTPLYMSPEQAELSGLDVDTRSDVYSLGVLLYELLAGTTPFDKERLQTVGLDEMRRIICEEEPARPSTRISTLGQAAVTVSANRGSDPDRLSALIRGDLDWIVMKALEKDRNRRYESASAFAADIQRYLTDEPVLACPPTLRYRIGKFLRRNRGPVLVGSVVSVALLGGLIGAAYGSIEARNKQAVAQLYEQAVEARRDAELARDGETSARLAAENARTKLRIVEYGRTSQVSYEEWRDNNVPATLELLNSTQVDLRGWEWRYIFRLCHSHILVLKGPMTPPVLSTSFSPDGTRVVAAGEDNAVKVWDAKSGAELVAFRGHAVKMPLSGVLSASFSRDGSRVVTGGRDLTARIWDAKSGVELLVLKGHTGDVWSASFSPDGTQVLTGSGDRTARLWNAQTGAELLVLKGHTREVRSASFSPDGSRVVTGGNDNTAKVWDVKTGAEVLTLKGHTAALTSASFSPDGSRVLTSSGDGTARVWDVKTGAEFLILTGHTGFVTSASFSRDGARIITGGRDRAARIWDAKTGTELSTLKGHIDGVSSATFSPDGMQIVTGSWDGSVRIWDAKAEAGFLALRSQGGVLSASFSRDGLRVVTGGRDRTARIWDARTGTELLILKGHTGDVASASFSPDGARVLTGSGDRTARIWDANTGAEVLTLKGHTAAVSSVSFSPDGTQILTGSADGSARIWDARIGAELRVLKGHIDGIATASFSPDGSRVVTAGIDRTARVWDAKTGAEIVTFKGHAVVLASASFSPDGLRVVTGGYEPTARVWDARTGAELFVLKGHTRWVRSASFSPDGSRVVTGSEDGSVKVWDAQTGAELLTLKGHTNAVSAASFSSDGTRILTGSWDGTARIWDGTPVR